MTDQRRLEGIDIARALAIFGMVIVNFKIALSAISDNSWLSGFSGLIEGRASALFVLLAGVGISLLRARSDQEATEQTLKIRYMLLKRGALLLLTGLLFTAVWPADILHFYGVYFAVAALLFNAGGRSILLAAMLFVAVFPLLLQVFDYDQGWNWQDYSYQGFWTVDGMVRHLLFNGFHPVVPWTAFLLFGLWLGRLELRNRAVRWRGICCSAAVLLLLEGSLWGLRQWLAADWPAADIEALLTTTIIPPLPQYMFSATASSVLILMLCLSIPRHWLQTTPLKMLTATGRLSLTLYVAHVLLGMGLLEALGLLQQQSLELALISALLFCLVGVLFSYCWLHRYRSGPLEWLFRKLSG